MQPLELAPPGTSTSNSSSHRRFKQTQQESRTFLMAREGWLVLAPFPPDPSENRSCSALTEELQEPGGDGSSGCEHLTSEL